MRFFLLASSAPLRGVKDEILRCTRVEYQRVKEGGDSLLSPSLSAKHDHYLLKEVHLPKDSTLAMDRGYVDIAQFQRLTEEGVFAIHGGTVIFCY